MKSNTHTEDNNIPKGMPALSLSSIAVRASILSLGLASGASQAASIVVTSNADDNGTDCTLRQAIVSINTLGLQGGCINTGDMLGTNDSITFADNLSSNTITLDGSQLDIMPGKNITIDASSVDNGITVDANHLSVAIYVTLATLVIDNMVISNGSYYGGGGISAYQSEVSLSNTTVSGNFSEVGGGGISGFGSHIALNSSTVSGNSTSGGGAGGIYARNASSISLINSTVSGNFSNGTGGGVTATENTNVSFSNSTVSDNTSGGVMLTNSSLLISNSIIANSLSGDDCDLSNAVVLSDSASIIEDGSCGLVGRAGDPGLLPLNDNGGPTQTHALRSNSIAINTGILSGANLPYQNCTPSDQRGENRSDGGCDVGAFEYIDLGGFYVIPIGNKKSVVVPL